MYRDLLADATFHQLLLACDADLADAARAARCARCGGTLHSACYPRKPRGRPCRLGPEYDRRFSFCCAVDGCRFSAGRVRSACTRHSSDEAPSVAQKREWIRGEFVPSQLPERCCAKATCKINRLAPSTLDEPGEVPAGRKASSRRLLIGQSFGVGLLGRPFRPSRYGAPALLTGRSCSGRARRRTRAGDPAVVFGCRAAKPRPLPPHDDRGEPTAPPYLLPRGGSVVG